MAGARYPARILGLMATKVADRLTEQRRNLPDQPGVYVFRDAKGRVLYVGKAKSIRKRGASHFSGRTQYGSTELGGLIDSVEGVGVAPEAGALLGGQEFLKGYKPRLQLPVRHGQA